MMWFGYVLAGAAAVGWGLTYAIDQKILGHISPVTLLFVHSVFATIILLPFVLLRVGGGESLGALGRVNWIYFIVAIVVAILANLLILSSIKLLGAPTASIFEIAYPFFVVLFSFFLFRSTPNIYFFLGGALIFLGSLVIIKWA